MAVDYPLINGFRYSFADVEIKMKNRRRRGVTEVNYTTSREHGDVSDNSDRKIGRTRGTVRNEASITMLKEEADAFIKELGPEFGTKSFDVPVTYSSGITTVTDLLRGCCISSVGNAHRNSADALVVQLQLNVMEIKLSGRSI